MRKLTEKQKRIKREQKERREINKKRNNSNNTVEPPKKDTLPEKEKMEFTYCGEKLPFCKEWLIYPYASRKIDFFYQEFIQTFKKKNTFYRDINFENFWYLSERNGIDIRDYRIQYNGNDPFLLDMMPCVELFRQKRYQKACRELQKLLDKYPSEGFVYYYYGRAFAYEFDKYYSLRFLKRAVELNGYIEMYLEYANMLMVCGNEQVRMNGGLTSEAKQLYKASIEVFAQAEEKYPNCGDIDRMRRHMDLGRQTPQNPLDALTKKFYPYDKESGEWQTENLLFPIEEDLLIE